MKQRSTAQPRYSAKIMTMQETQNRVMKNLRSDYRREIDRYTQLICFDKGYGFLFHVLFSFNITDSYVSLYMLPQ
jgi:hypothetical protein